MFNLSHHFENYKNYVAQSNLLSASMKAHQSMQRPRPGSFGSSASASFGSSKSFPTSSSSGSLAPPPPSNTQRNTNRTQIKSNETDLISFSHPADNSLSNDSLLLGNDLASVTSPVPDSHSNFKQMVDEIHR